MSDQHGDRDGAPSETTSTSIDSFVDDDGLQPAVASRLESVHGTLSTLGMRIDALVTSTTTYRSALTDRLNEYSDLVTKLARTQANDLEEYRRANERTINDLRRSLSSSEEALTRVASRVEAIVGDKDDAGDQGRQIQADLRAVLDAHENLGQFLTTSLDQFGTRVVDRMTATQSEVDEHRQSILSALGPLATRDDQAALREEIGAARDAIERLAERVLETGGGDASAAQLDTIAGRLDVLFGRIDEIDRSFEAVNAKLTETASAEQLQHFGGDVRAQLVDSLGSADGNAVLDRLTRIEQELTSGGQVSAESWGELAGLRVKIDAVLDASTAEATQLTTLVDEIRETLLDTASGEVVGALWDEVRGIRISLDDFVERVETESAEADAAEAAMVGAGPDAAVLDAVAELRQILEQATTIDEADLAGPADAGLAAEVAELNTAVRSLLDAAEVDDGEFDDETTSAIDAIAADLAGLRMQLGAGLEVDSTELDVTIGGLRSDLASLHDQLVAMAEAGSDDGEPSADAVAALADMDGKLAGLATATDVAQLRSAVADLADGMAMLQTTVTKAAASDPDPDGAGPEDGGADGFAPADALESIEERLDAVAAEVAKLTDLRSTIATVTDIERAIEAAVQSVAGDDAGDGDPDAGGGGWDAASAADIEGDLRILRTGVEDIIARLDEGLELAEDELAPPAESIDGPSVGDQIAVLRDELRAELDGLRQFLEEARAGTPAPASDDGAGTDVDAVTELIEHMRDDLAELPYKFEQAAGLDRGGQGYATIDPDTIDLLRTEIREAAASQPSAPAAPAAPAAAAGVSDEVLDAVRKELVALRRRIKLRAEGEILSEDQLELIADAVARKLAG